MLTSLRSGLQAYSLSLRAETKVNKKERI